MTKDDILRMAREAQIIEPSDPDDGDFVIETVEILTCFANLVAVAEREACARDWELAHGFDKHGVAAAIRARGQS